MENVTICKIEGCESFIDRHKKMELCNKHYSRQFRNGDPCIVLTTPKGEPLEYLKKHMYDGCCYPWPYAKNGDRPTLVYNGKSRLAYCVVLELNGKPKPFENAQSRHLCGKGHLGCFNFECLKWGTASENSQDSLQHGTRANGERNGSSKFTNEQILAIRSLKSDHSDAEIAKQFGCSRSMIWLIVTRRAWNHI